MALIDQYLQPQGTSGQPAPSVPTGFSYNPLTNITTSPSTVVTPKLASTAIGGIKTSLADVTTGLQNQSANNNAIKTATDAAAEKARNDLAAGYYKATDATGQINIYPTGSRTALTPEQFAGISSGGQKLNANLIKFGEVPPPPIEKTIADIGNEGKIPAGMDAQSYYNFKAANPNLEPTAEDIAKFKETTPTDTYTAGVQNGIDEEQAKLNEYQNKIAQIQQGTFPLTDSQNAQLSAIQHQFDQLKEQQKVANQAYTQGTQTAEIASGRSEHFREISQGNVAAAINVGIQKIADLDSKAAETISTLKQAFMDSDYKMISDQYDKYQKFVSDKSAALKEIHDSLISAQKAIKDQAHQDLQDKLESDKFSNDVKQQAIDNAFKQAQITETERHNMATELQAKIAQGQANGDVGSHPSVSMTGNGVPSKAQQASFLQSLGNPDLATLVSGIADYSINPASVPTRNYRGVGGLTQSQVLTLVKQYDPSFEQGQYAARQALQTQFKSGKYSQNINALNTAVGHISDVIDNFSSLNNAGFTPYNQAKNTIEKLFGAGGIARASLNIQAATAELATVFKGSGATNEEIKALGVIDPNSSPDQVKAYIETATQLLASRLNALDDTYQSGMGKASDKTFLSPSSVNNLLKLQQQGFNIQVPELARAPQVLLQTFHDSDPKAAQMLDQLIASDPSLKSNPQAVIDLLAQNGIEL